MQVKQMLRDSCTAGENILYYFFLKELLIYKGNKHEKIPPIFQFLLCVTLIISCENPTDVKSKVAAPTLSNIQIVPTDQGFSISWEIEEIDGYEKMIRINRGESTQSIDGIGQTGLNLFIDRFVHKEKLIIIQSRFHNRKNLQIVQDIRILPPSSPLLISPAATSGNGELTSVSNLSAVGGGGKINLTWSPPTVSLSSTLKLMYYIRRYTRDPENHIHIHPEHFPF